MLLHPWLISDLRFQYSLECAGYSSTSRPAHWASQAKFGLGYEQKLAKPELSIFGLQVGPWASWQSSQRKANNIRSFTTNLFHNLSTSILNSPMGRPLSKPTFSTQTLSSGPEVVAAEGEDGEAPSSSPLALDDSLPLLLVLVVDNLRGQTRKVWRGRR